MKDKLHQIQNPWHRFMITVLVNSLLLLSQVQSFRSRVHWVGGPRRSRRLERLAIIVLFVFAFILLEPHQLAYWSTLLGWFTSIFVATYSIYFVIPRR